MQGDQELPFVGPASDDTDEDMDEDAQGDPTPERCINDAADAPGRFGSRRSTVGLLRAGSMSDASGRHAPGI